MYMHILELLLIVISFLKKNDLIILFIMRKITRLKDVKKPIIMSTIGRTIQPILWLVIGTEMQLAIGPTTEPESIKNFFMQLAIKSAGTKELLPN